MKGIISAFIVAASLQFVNAQETRNVGDFSTLKVYDRIPVELISSNQNKVEIYGYNQSDVEVVNKNGQLKIRMTVTKTLQGDDSKVKVYYENLSDVQASQGAKITSNDVLKANMLKLTSNEGSNINLEVKTDRLNVKGNSGGILNISGKADSQDIVINSGAIFNGADLKSENATITTNAGGEVNVYASKSVNATTRAGGKIVVYGDPDDRNVKKVAGGNIEFK